MAKIIGTEVMQDPICHESLIKGDLRFYSEPFTGPPVLILCTLRVSLRCSYQIPGCKCGIDKSCAYSGWLCNCYANDNVWRYDEGYVTDKQRLPLTEVRLGDTGGWAEYGKHTIGPMICTETRT